ncbi:MAG: transcription antitermination factor NusB [Gammaproteobacteria bacterium]|jgi:N utilization substance protein B
MRSKRSQARRHAAQALYQWQVTADDVGAIVNQFLVAPDAGTFDAGYFRELVRGVAAALDRLDAELQPFLDRPVEQIDLVERAVLRIGAYELAKHPEVPYRVVINEAVELAKVFGAEQGHRYVNGVLDRLARQLRPHESSPRS